jgi:hypothetical protein
VVDYSFYSGIYRGSSIPEADWQLFESRAAEQLARYKRIFTVTAPDDNAEAMAICAMADALAYFAAAQNGAGGAVASASIGSVSVSYAGTAAVDISPKAQAKELYRCACQYLEIYRGVG